MVSVSVSLSYSAFMCRLHISRTSMFSKVSPPSVPYLSLPRRRVTASQSQESLRELAARPAFVRLRQWQASRLTGKRTLQFTDLLLLRDRAPQIAGRFLVRPTALLWFAQGARGAFRCAISALGEFRFHRSKVIQLAPGHAPLRILQSVLPART